MGDNLEKFFNKQLGEDIPKADWNSPSPSIWDNAQKEINKKKPRNKSIIFLWVANGILLAGLLYALIYINLLKDKTSDIESNYKEQIDNYTSKLNESSLVLNNKYENTSTQILKSNDNNSINLKSQNLLDKQNISINILNDSIKHFLKNRKENISIHKEDISEIGKQDIQNIGFMNRSKVLLNGSEKINTDNNAIKKVKKKKFNAEYLHGLGLNPLLSQNPELNISLLLNDIKTFDKKKIKQPNNILGVYFGPILTAAPMTGEIPQDFSTLVGSSDLLLSYEFGTEYSRRLFDNLFFKTGITFRRIKFWSKAEISDSYDKSTEYINKEGEIENIQPFVIPTALGYINTEFILSHPLSMQLDQGDQINATMHLTQHLYYIRIPLGLDYYYPINKNMKIRSGIGLSYNKIVGYKNLFNPILSHNGSEMGYINLKSSSMDVSNSINYFFTLGATHSINNNIDIFTDIQYFRNLEKIYETEKMITKVHGFSLKIGGNYNF